MQWQTECMRRVSERKVLRLYSPTNKTTDGFVDLQQRFLLANNSLINTDKFVFHYFFAILQKLIGYCIPFD
jgi:hypothetical protein